MWSCSIVNLSKTTKFCFYHLKNFTKEKIKNETCFGQPFYSGNPGYKMYLRVHPNGNGWGQGQYLSVYVCLLCGKYDDQLNWPFIGSIIIRLIESGGNHFERIVYWDHSTRPEFSHVYDQSSMPNGFPTFLSHQRLMDPSLQYLKDDTLIIEAMYKNIKFH